MLHVRLFAERERERERVHSPFSLSALDVSAAVMVGVFFGHRWARWQQVYLITLGNANSIIKAGVVFRKEEEERAHTHTRARDPQHRYRKPNRPVWSRPGAVWPTLTHLEDAQALAGL